MDKVRQILKAAKCLSDKELKKITDSLLNMLGVSNKSYDKPGKRISKCRKCASEKIIKFGVDKNGKQRYRCKSCGATFTETSYSVTSQTRHSDDVWEKYIHLLLVGASLEECAFQCRISVRTAFIWRHKILNALQKDQDNRVMAGIIEADEMFLPISYKGNHKNSKRFTMPRKAFRRGSDNRSNNYPKVCIMCAVERNGQSYGEVLGQGQPTTKMVTHAFTNRIVRDSIMLSDRTRAMKSFFTKNPDIQLIQLKASVAGKKYGGAPEVRGIYHIQTVNNFHNRLQRFLRHYNGVSTKYLNHYINLFVWIENHKRLESRLEDSLKTYIAEKSTYATANTLFDRASVPCVA